MARSVKALAPAVCHMNIAGSSLVSTRYFLLVSSTSYNTIAFIFSVHSLSAEVNGRLRRKNKAKKVNYIKQP